jgi:hypothetical protein
MKKQTTRFAACLAALLMASCGGCEGDKKAAPAPTAAKAVVPASKPAPQKAAAPAPKKKTPEEIKAIRNKVDEDGVVRRGETFTVKEQVSVAIAFSKAKELDGERMKITGKVDDVSSNGCSFSMKEGTQSIKVSSAGCSILAPEFSTGMWATAEGTMSVTEVEKDGQTDRTVALRATGFELRKM